ncbi:ABC transporter ATP-binding protein [Caenispirillum bisanense]|uniref:ABC transporter ATP-binding protein n=1 Tax=Caenispirillum bisanense TaxID=414052 RepID=UPI0031DD1E1E
MTEAPSPQGPRAAPARSTRDQVRWAWSFVAPHRATLAAIALTSLLGVGVGLAQPWITKLLIDDALIGGNLRLLVGLSIGMVVIGIVSTALSAWTRWIYVRASGRILFAMRGRVHAHLLTLSPRFYARWKTGDLMSRLDGDIGEILRFAVDAPLAALNAVLVLAGALTLMLLLDPWLTALALALLPAQLLFLRWVRPIVDRRTRALRERAGEVSSFLVRSLQAVKVVQAFRAEAAERRQLDRLGGSYLDDLLRLQMVNFAAGAVPGLFGSVGNALVFVAGGLMVLNGSFTLGGLIAFTAYLGRATGPLQSLLGLWVAVRRARVSLDRVMEVLDAAPDVQDPPQPRRLADHAAASVVLDRVSFRHHADGPLVLDGASLEVRAGSKVVIVGASGAGKSTMVDLLHRHFDPEAGTVRVGWEDVRDLALADLRRQVAVMGQEVVLFPGTIADVLRLGAPDADDAAVERAARAAQLGPLLDRLPLGLATPVGEAGALFSGGERQRMALARCLLLDPAVLVLDEPTSALDAATAAALAAEIDRLFGHRTRIVVSHRPDMLAGADAVWELRGGRFHRLPVAAAPHQPAPPPPPMREIA